MLTDSASDVLNPNSVLLLELSDNYLSLYNSCPTSMFSFISIKSCKRLAQSQHFLKITNNIINGWLLTHTIKKILSQYLNIHIFYLTFVIFHPLMKTINILFHYVEAKPVFDRSTSKFYESF